MQTIENEANELLQSAKDARIDNKYANALSILKSMPEVSLALRLILEQVGQNPNKVLAHAFLLGAYMGLSYNNMRKFEE
jgi:hypothetical protein